MSEQHGYAISKGKRVGPGEVAIIIRVFKSVGLCHEPPGARHCGRSRIIGVSYYFPSQRSGTEGRHQKLYQMVRKFRPEGTEMEKPRQRTHYREAFRAS